MSNTRSGTELVLKNCRLVLPEGEVAGTLVVRDGLIAEIHSGPTTEGEDCDGDHLLPGLIDLHADHLETNLTPRAGVSWPVTSAVQWHDRVMIAAGVTTAGTTVALRTIPGRVSFADVEQHASDIAKSFEVAEHSRTLAADHFLHLRCELTPDASAADLLEGSIRDPRVRLVSLMDHSPGQRQFLDPKAFRSYYGRRYGMSDEELDAYEAVLLACPVADVRRSRARIVALAHANGVAIASHDDATSEHVVEAQRDRVAISEFPTTAFAAESAHAAGIAVLMGAPNIVLNRSHTSNLSARIAAENGWLDILSSDYAPQSLLEAIFLLASHLGVGLHQTTAMATSAPARLLPFLHDRGSLEVGKRADLLRVRHVPDLPPFLRCVYVRGLRVG